VCVWSHVGSCRAVSCSDCVCVGVLLCEGFCLFVWLTICGNAFDRVVPFLCRVVSCRVVSCRVVSVSVLVCCCVRVLFVHVVGYVVFVVLCRVVSFRVVSCRVVSCRVVSLSVCCWPSMSLAL
jgi:hypothetical protein